MSSQHPAEQAVLLSVRPKYAELIMSGEKRTEFRKMPFGRHVSHAVLYASSPVCLVLGYFEIESLEIETPRNLWRAHQMVGGASFDEFMAYFGKSRLGVAIRIGRVWESRGVVLLSSIDRTLTPPQSFTYLSRDVFACVKGLCCESCQV